MNLLDWAILAVYILVILSMSYFVGRQQESQEDYYVGGRSIPAWQAALSIVATQVSAISLIGAPAFIALKSGGGLKWLQYELAIPLAMIVIMGTVVPIYRRTGVISIYEYLEQRFGPVIRSLLAFIFMVSRGLASGVALLATSIVTSVCLDLPLFGTVLLIGIVAIAYTTLGGIRADIYSDIIQLVILWGGAFICLFILFRMSGGYLMSPGLPRERFVILQMTGVGLGDGQTFGFWPMLVGGFFLYLSYYGCDQSETQRLLTTQGEREAQKALLINGLLRFPLVITYCGVGVLLIPFLVHHPAFLAGLEGKPPDFLLPCFILRYMPHGMLGLLVGGIFAASMSSLDSALNSLSAVSLRDFLQKYIPSLRRIGNRKEVWLSKLLTVMWGMLCTIFALGMIGGSETVLVLVNKIGSAFYGPILAVFWLGIMTQRANEQGAILGLVIGVGVNILVWSVFGNAISWLWWNPIGFFSGFMAGYAGSLIFARKIRPVRQEVPGISRVPMCYAVCLTGAFGGILVVCLILQFLLSG